MLCVTCKSEVSAAFKHAITKNECPACGGAIFDEETLALIDDIKRTIFGEAVLREETVQRLAFAVVARYDLTVRQESRAVVSAAVQLSSQPAKRIEVKQQAELMVEEEEENVKIAPPSVLHQAAAITAKPNVIGVADLERQASVSEMERIQIMEETARDRYNLVDQAVDTRLSPEEMAMFSGSSGPAVSLPADLIDSGVNPVLEQERLLRLQKQRAALDGSGKSAFRRSG